ncbi:hypothetical protein N836_28895 [Leptolyngbya sp. Heron Island J]|uniref:hypothetical protein n=1 Tax=Leptolyngbya sp. Heron Island J TaxID=1385935 RepID=UPI0003B9BC64|nr:hypothetical protein [Leptolyngbya sp. Heron Island J]ESA39096.1 hypothetical protein N836_28895 [Leptolyngbya sp. Heron Island J]
MTTRIVKLTVPDGQTDGEWATIDKPSTLTRFARLLTPPNTPSTTLTLSVRRPENPSAVYSVKLADGTGWSITVDGLGSYTADALAPLANQIDGLEWRPTLGTAPTGDAVFELEII